jgi:hypothetical protein
VVVSAAAAAIALIQLHLLLLLHRCCCCYCVCFAASAFVVHASSLLRYFRCICFCVVASAFALLPLHLLFVVASLAAAAIAVVSGCVCFCSLRRLLHLCGGFGLALLLWLHRLLLLSRLIQAASWLAYSVVCCVLLRPSLLLIASAAAAAIALASVCFCGLNRQLLLLLLRWLPLHLLFVVAFASVHLLLLSHLPLLWHLAAASAL